MSCAAVSARNVSMIGPAREGGGERGGEGVLVGGREGEREGEKGCCVGDGVSGCIGLLVRGEWVDEEVSW